MVSQEVNLRLTMLIVAVMTEKLDDSSCTKVTPSDTYYYKHINFLS